MSDTITPEERAYWRRVIDEEPLIPSDDEKILRLLNALDAAEAESARLRAERDWLAGQLHGLGPKYNDVICPQEKCHATGDCIDCWTEAARRAVDDAESEVE